MAQPLSPPQIRSALVDTKGLLTGPWPEWFQIVWRRIPRHGRAPTLEPIAAGARADVVVSWTPAFEDSNFSVTVAIEDLGAAGAGLRVERIRAKERGSVTVQVINDSGVSLSGTVDAVAVHD